MDSAHNGNEIYAPEKILHTDFVFLKGHFCLWRLNLRWKNKLEVDHFTLYLLNVAHASLCVYSMLTSPALKDIVCPTARHVTWLGVCYAPALHTLSPLCLHPPTPSPRLCSPAVFFISFCVLFLSLAHPLALAVVVTECSLCPAVLHHCHLLRQSLARQQIQH